MMMMMMMITSATYFYISAYMLYQGWYIHIACFVIVLYKRSTSGVDGKTTAANGHVTNGEVNATGQDTSMYATIVPEVKSDNYKDKSGNDVKPEQPTVIYSEIMAKQT